MPVTSVMDLFPSLQEPGKRLVDAGELYEAFSMLFSTQSGIAAGAVAPGALMSAAFNQVISGSEVQLPMAIAGRSVGVFAATALTVNCQPSNAGNNGLADLVDGAATAAQAAGTFARYICYSVGAWSQVAPAAAPAPPEP